VTYSAEIDVLAPRAVSAPVRVQIPSIGADGLVAHVGVNEAGELEVPGNAKTLVWYRYGPSPGESGSAVIAGHLDWKGVRGTFNELAETPVGETVTVAYDDGSERAFIIRSVELVDKPAVSVNGTFARDGESVLRLVTCGGEFDRSAHSYYSNVVVTAVPA
jgi:sortase (surface protein transpeptidase)